MGEAINIYKFGAKGPDVDAAHRQQTFDELRDMLKGVAFAGKVFPTEFREAMKARLWEQERIFVSGKRIPPTSFHDFVHDQYPHGLDSDFAAIRRLIDPDPEAVLLFDELTQGRQGERTDLVDNINEVNRPDGTSKQYAVRRLRHAAEAGDERAVLLLEDYKAGRKSAHATNVEMGWRKPPPSPLEAAKRAWQRMSEDDRDEFREWAGF
jgi:hypothetical protein